MVYLTNILRDDGFGAQFQYILFSILFTELTGNTYIYTDIIDIEHITKTARIKENDNDNTFEEIINYMSIKQNYINYDTVKDIDTINKLDIHFVLRNVENNIDNIFNSDIFLKYKSYFYKDKKSRFDSKYVNIAIHIRRLSNYEKEQNMYQEMRHGVSNLYYLDKINLIRDIYNGKQIKFHIYSQGKVENFNELISDDVIFHLNEKVLDTFTDLVFADILITSPSSFSYTAALLSNNEIWYLTFWHPPLRHWKVFKQIS